MLPKLGEVGVVVENHKAVSLVVDTLEFLERIGIIDRLVEVVDDGPVKRGVVMLIIVPD